jgi:hypothetical protein
MSIIDIVAPTGFECGFQSNLDFYNKKYCFKYDYATNGRKCMIIGDDKNIFMEWFKNLPYEQRKLYELIREDDIVAEYYDIDFKIEEKMDEETVNNLSDDIIRVLLDARNEVSQQIISRKDLIVLSAHTPIKLSLHVISKKTYFMNNKLQRIFAQDVYNQINDLSNIFNIDTSVYSKNRCFRMFLNHKYGKDNTLVLFNPQMYSYASFEETWVVLTHQDISNRIKIEKYTEDDLTIRQYHDDTEELTQDLEQLLKDFIEKYPYLQAEVDSAKVVNRINRIDHTTRPCLTDPSDCHSTENLYWYINNNCLYVGCFCKKGEHICLGMRSGIHKIEIESEPFDYATHCSDDFKSYDDFKNITTLYDKRRTGRGKTTCAMNYAKKFERVLLIHHRLTLDADYINKYPDFVSYQTGVNSPKQTVCFNSLSKIDITNYDLIIIDEIRSILKQTEMKNMVYSTHTLFNILENTNTPVIMLDANMTNADIKFISKHRVDSNRIIIHDENVTTTKNVFIVAESLEEELLSKIDGMIKNNQKVVVVYNKSIEHMNGILAPYSESYRVLHINRLTRENIDMNSDTWYDNYDIIAYSPTMSEGVSINDKRFKNVHAFGMFTSTSCTAESVSQMIARFRAIENFTIHLSTKHTKSVPVFHKKEDVLYYINNNINKLHVISQAHYNMQRSNGKIAIIEDEFCELFCKNLLEQSLDYHNYRNTLIQKLVNNGYNVFEDFNAELSVEETESLKEKVKLLQDDERNRMNQCILEAPLISSDEFIRMIDMGTTCEEDECKIEKYKVLNIINIDSTHLTTDIIHKFRESNIQCVIRNIKHCFAFIRNEYGAVERISTSVLIKENAANIMLNFDKRETFLDQKKCLTHFKTSKLDWLNAKVRELGFSYLLSPEYVDLNIFEENMQRIISYYSDPKNYNKYVNTELIFGASFSREKQKELTRTFLTNKLRSLFSTNFGIDKINKRVYQQITLPVRLYDETRTYPNIIGGIMLPRNVVQKYDTMFMRGIQGDYCSVCDITLEHGGIGFKHLTGKKHLENMNTIENE